MSAFLSKSCEYALQTLIYIAGQPVGKRALIKDISSDLGIPTHFLAKVMQTMTRAGLLTSFRGVRGGFTLARSADEITLLDVMKIVDGLDWTERCILGLRGCMDEDKCPLHGPWGKLRAEIMEMMGSNTIYDMARQGSTPGSR